MRSLGTPDNSHSSAGRSELIALGKRIVTDRLEAIGCAVMAPASPTDGRLEIRTPDGRSVEIFVSTQRVGGYAFWTKRRLQPASHRFVAIVLLGVGPGPELYLVPTDEWRQAAPPLTDRDYEGKASDPEYGMALGRSSLGSLARYAWTDRATAAHFR